ncbi:MAG TPA: YfhO family protein [Pyrinomonadaceae bacterium]
MTRPNVPRVKVKTDHVAAVAVTLGPVLYFLPALLNHLILAPDDGRLFNAPLRVATAQIIRSGHLPLWDPYIFGGMPLFASAQGGLLFPPNWFYLIFSPALATNLMVVTTYMLAALGAYLFARRTGASISGAIVTSITWQAGGFLLAQISHINIVHTAAVLPWVFWALERYVANGKRTSGALLAALIAIQVFAGHQQTFAYGLILVGAYTIVMVVGKTEHRRRYLKSLAFTLTGLLLAAVQILPTAELLRNSVRASATYDFFTSFSMPRAFVMTLFAPYILGGGDKRLFQAPYIGQLYYAEYVAYAGLLGVMLVLLALLLKPDRRTKFWAVALVIGFVLALGNNAPLQFNRLIYLVPVLNLFRVPARHLLEVNFAIAVLAGRGLTALERLRGTKRASKSVLIVASSVVVVTILIITALRPSNFQLAREVPVTVLRAPELFLPIVFAFLSAFALWLFVFGRRHGSTWILVVLIADLLLWGQFSGWYIASRNIPKEFWSVPESVQLLREQAPHDSYRILTTHHTFDPAAAVPNTPANGWTLWTEPDVYMMHGIQNAAGYDGFGLDRYSQLAGGMKLWGELTEPDVTLRGNSRELDLLNVRYLVSRRKDVNDLEPSAEAVIPSEFASATQKYGDLLFAPTDLTLPNINADKRLTLKTPGLEVDRVALLTNLSFAENVADNTIVARLHLRTKDGHAFEFPLRAGVDTADWAFDRPDIHARIRHKRATIATNYDVNDAQNKYQGHTYVTSFTLPEKATIESGYTELEPEAKPAGYLLRVFRVSFFSNDRTYAVSQNMVNVEAQSATVASETKDERWKLLVEGEKVRIYENARTLPRAWLATDTRVLSDAMMLGVIRSGLLPDGTKWDPVKVALLSAPLTKSLIPGNGTVAISDYEPNRIDLKTDSSAESLLVLSENYYPGWRAYVDGQAVEMIQVNYAQRGVVVPAGQHQISFSYRPWSVMLGLVISLLTAVGLGVYIARGRQSVPRGSE